MKRNSLLVTINIKLSVVPLLCTYHHMIGLCLFRLYHLDEEPLNRTSPMISIMTLRFINKINSLE